MRRTSGEIVDGDRPAAGRSLGHRDPWARQSDRAALEDVLRIEFSAATAARAIAATAGVELAVGYRLHVRRKALR